MKRAKLEVRYAPDGETKELVYSYNDRGQAVIPLGFDQTIHAVAHTFAEVFNQEQPEE